MKVVDCRSGDPVELAAHEVRELASRLLTLADVADSE
jgi:hypothetical protein